MPTFSVSDSIVTSGNGYSFVRSITIDHTQCGTADSTNFPLLFLGTFTYLKTVGNGGKVQNGSGFDIIFTSDQAGQNKLNFERVGWDGLTGIVEFWVQIPTLSHTVDTVIYIFYGNALISTDQQNSSGTWDSTFVAVYHLKDGTTLSLTDSTGNGNNGTNHGTSAATGTINGGMSTGSASNYVVTAGAPIGSNSRFISAWIKAASVPQSSIVFEEGNESATGNGFFFYVGTDHVLHFDKFGRAVGSVGTVDDNNWHYVGIGFNGTNIDIMRDGVSAGSANYSGEINTAAGTQYISSYVTTPGTLGLNGSFDEFRIANVQRSSDWYLSEYNNQKSGSTFLTIGSETTTSSGEADNLELVDMISSLDTVTTAEVRTLAPLGVSVSVSESVAASESAAINTFLLNVSDATAVIVSEQVGLNVQVQINVSDSVTTSEQETNVPTSFIAATDSAVTSEQIIVDIVDNISVFEMVLTGSGPSFVHIGANPVIPPLPVFTGFRTTGVILSPFSR